MRNSTGLRQGLSRTILTNHALRSSMAPPNSRTPRLLEMLASPPCDAVRDAVRMAAVAADRTRWLEKRALILPQELKAMGPRPRSAYEGLACPVRCRKIRYYRDRYFTRRLLPRVPIAHLEIAAAPSPAPCGPEAQKPHTHPSHPAPALN